MELPDVAVRLRRLAAGLLGLAYLVAVGSFWVLGAIAWARSVDGVLSFLGVLFLPILLLPIVGEGQVAGIDAASPVWWAWFALLMLLAAAAVFSAPRVRRQAPDPTGGADDASAGPDDLG
jgi:hypothetical protein